jgi:(1->4)-alpha-D-glucan 1-alpha-D-glucosylmutase
MAETALASELQFLGALLKQLSESDPLRRDMTRHGLTTALRELIACFPVSRTYIRNDGGGMTVADREVIDTAVHCARRRNPMLSATLFDYLHETLVLPVSRSCAATQRQQQHLFVQKFQHLTTAVGARAGEAVCYQYTPLVSLNAFGGDLDQFGCTVMAVHQGNLARQQRSPHTMLTTSTHDTRYSEDIRARLNVLSELPQQWQTCLYRWQGLNSQHKSRVDGQLAPNGQEEYLLYQTLLGAWPMPPVSAEERMVFCQRVQHSMCKALREAKVHTSWVNVHVTYEDAVKSFVTAILDETRSAPFLEDFRVMQQAIAHHGIWNALAQTLLKIAAPGVPDIYQGCELWDFSLADPDNRRPVDYEQRQQHLTALRQRCQRSTAARLELVRELLHARDDGRIKLYTLWQALTYRRSQTRVFLQGDYIPLEVVGSKQEHVCAFARVHEDTVVLVVVPRLPVRLLSAGQEAPLGCAVWEDTRILLPETSTRRHYGQIFTAQQVTAQNYNGRTALLMAELLDEFPVALLGPTDTILEW